MPVVDCYFLYMLNLIIEFVQSSNNQLETQSVIVTLIIFFFSPLTVVKLLTFSRVLHIQVNGFLNVQFNSFTNWAFF